MKPITRRALRVLNDDEIHLITLIDLRVAGSDVSSTLRVTDAGEQITWNGNTYLPVRLTRSRMDDRLVMDSGSVPALQINVANVSTDMARMIQENELTDADVVVRLADKRILSNSRDAWIISAGKLKEPTLTRSIFSFRVINVLGDMDRTSIPRRLWQPHCSVAFGSKACNVNLLASPNSITETMQAGTTAYYVVVTSAVLTAAGNPSDPNDYWQEGQMTIISGDAATQSVPISRYQQVGTERRFYARRPFLVTPTSGLVLIQRGCPKTKSACFDRQGHYLNYHGFEEVPYGQLKPTIIGDIPSV